MKSNSKYKLPERTQKYLAHGAEVGRRNCELLAAACQYRDAGMNDTGSEQTLIARALFDGLTPGEATSTVRSAFSRPARAPIQSMIGDYTSKPLRLNGGKLALIESQKADRRLAARANCGLHQILRTFACGVEYYGNRSPFSLSNVDRRDDWRLLLQLFQPEDVIWIGTRKNESANDTHDPEWIQYCKTRFRPVSEWLADTQCPGILTCPNAFMPGAYSRSDSKILTRCFLVVESDSLDPNQVCAVFRWTQQFTKLRAIVDTGGKSLHGWFEIPAPDVLGQLKTILPQLGCDPAMFTPSQPCRLPGRARPETGRPQSLLYIDLGREA